MRKLHSALVIVFVLVFSQIRGQELEAFKITPEWSSVKLEINDNASFKIIGHEGNDITVNLYKGLDQVKLIKNPSLSYTEKNGVILLYRNGNFRTLFSNENLEYRIKVPKHIALKLHNSKSKIISVKNIIGTVEISSGFSDVIISNIVGDIDVHTFRGNISVDRQKGSALLYSNRGNIKISFSEILKGSNNIIESQGGDITLVLPGQASVSLKIKCDIGGYEKFESDFDLKPLNASSFPLGTFDKKSLYRSINGGGPPIYVRTFRGSVKIKSL